MHGRGAKTYSTFALTNEAYALSTSARAHCWPTRRILWLQAFLHLYWVAGATTGALLGALIPDRVTGLSFAMTALFAVLAIEAIQAGRGDLPTPVLAAASALAARLLFPGQLLLTVFVLFTAGCWPATWSPASGRLMPDPRYRLAAVAVSAAVT